MRQVRLSLNCGIGMFFLLPLRENYWVLLSLIRCLKRVYYCYKVTLFYRDAQMPGIVFLSVLLQICCEFHKSSLSPFPSFGEGGVAESQGGRWIHNVDNKRFMHSPTTSPYGYSSFPKEESCRYYRL